MYVQYNLSKIYYFTAEKPNKLYLNQMIKVNITSDKS